MWISELLGELNMDIEQRVEKNKVYDDLETSGSDIEIVKVEYRGKKGVEVKQKSSVDDTYASTSEEEDFIENPFKK